MDTRGYVRALLHTTFQNTSVPVALSFHPSHSPHINVFLSRSPSATTAFRPCSRSLHNLRTFSLVLERLSSHLEGYLTSSYHAAEGICFLSLPQPVGTDCSMRDIVWPCRSSCMQSHLARSLLAYHTVPSHVAPGESPPRRGQLNLVYPLEVSETKRGWIAGIKRVYRSRDVYEWRFPFKIPLNLQVLRIVGTSRSISHLILSSG